MKVNDLLNKRAGAVSDAILPGVSGNILGMIPGLNLVSGVANASGSVSGLFSPTTPELRKRLADRNAAVSLVPGWGTFRQAQRLRGVADESREDGAAHPYAHLAAEQLSITPQLIAAMALGGGVGGVVGLGQLDSPGGPDKAMRSAGIGAGVGAGSVALAYLIGALAAAATKRRTRQEQTDTETGERTVLDLLVPGLASYDTFKRYGRSRDWDVAAQERKKTKNEQSVIV